MCWAQGAVLGATTPIHNTYPQAQELSFLPQKQEADCENGTSNETRAKDAPFAGNQRQLLGKDGLGANGWVSALRA